MRSSRTAPVTVIAVVIAIAIVAIAACSGGDDSANRATTTTTEPASTSSSAPASSIGSTAPASTAPATGCATPGPPMPNGAGNGEIADVDGDGRPDTAWLAGQPDGSRQLGITTASGGGDAVEVQSASPVGLVLLAVDADQRPPVELLVSDNRSVQLWAFTDCALQPVIGPDGEPYLFDLGSRGTGTGVGCVDADGGRRLVGLNVTTDDGTTVEWSRTVIELDSLEATHGATEAGTFRRPADDRAIDLLFAVSCGDLTITEDGIRQPEPAR